MFAVGMLRGKKGVRSFDIPKPVIKEPDDVLVRVKEVGLDGTDFNMVRYNLQDIAVGRNEIVMGHEMSGVVEEVGSEVKSLTPGDAVVMTVRRGCNECEPCRHNQSDMCLTGNYTERGIHKIDGSLTQLVVDREQYIVKVPPSLTRMAVFSEPLSIAEKAVEQVRVIQSRMPWGCAHPEHNFLSTDWGGCKTALVVGAGPLGLLMTAVLRLSEIHTFTSDIMDEESPKAKLAEMTGAVYIDARGITPQELVGMCCIAGTLDVIIEAAGAAETALQLVPYMSRSSIYVMTGIPRKETMIQVDAAQLIRQIVRYNQVIVGSVNSNRRHFEKALEDMGSLNSRFSGMLEKMLTHRFRLEDYEAAFALKDPGHIKTVIEVEAW